ncbi:MAG: hypothetical protein ACJ771_00065, partial [Chloroflexota bacterium]
MLLLLPELLDHPGRRARAHRVDGHAQQDRQLDLLYRPLEITGVEARELEEIVDQRPQGADV